MHEQFKIYTAFIRPVGLSTVVIISAGYVPIIVLIVPLLSEAKTQCGMDSTCPNSQDETTEAFSAWTPEKPTPSDGTCRRLRSLD